MACPLYGTKPSSVKFHLNSKAFNREHAPEPTAHASSTKPFSKFDAKWKKLRVNTSRPRQNGRHFADDTFKRIFLNENVRISIKTSLKFLPEDPINNIPALIQLMAWRRSGDKPLSEPMVVCLLTHICVTRHQWINNRAMYASCDCYAAVRDRDSQNPCEYF